MSARLAPAPRHALRLWQCCSTPFLQSRPASLAAASSSAPLESKQPPYAFPASNAAPDTSRPTRKPPRAFKAQKAAITMTPAAIERLQGLLAQPEPKLIRVGVRNKGCAGMAYHLEYVDKPGTFDEVVQQDGIKVLIDSKALFSIIGSEMDWVEDELSTRFAFKNPNIKDACGCGESFNIL